MTPLVRLLRPHQWIKNSFVVAGLVFSHRWHDPVLWTQVLQVFIVFCCISSAVYVLNDWMDREADRLHPVKRRRPLASGQVSAPVAAATGLLLMGVAVALSWGNRALAVLVLIYVAMNLAYSWGFKRVPVVDVWIIAAGFMLRLLAGTVAVDIPPSRWLLLTGIFTALFLGFAKRRAETFHDANVQRAVMAGYPVALIDSLMTTAATATVMSYSLFATSDAALAVHGERLAYTIPLVLFGMMRYAWQVHRGGGEDVSRELLRDPWTLGAAVLWLLVFSGVGFRPV